MPALPAALRPDPRQLLPGLRGLLLVPQLRPQSQSLLGLASAGLAGLAAHPDQVAITSYLVNVTACGLWHPYEPSSPSGVVVIYSLSMGASGLPEVEG